eukprot:Colp12_sorted_trinity150504_noHs@17425
MATVNVGFIDKQPDHETGMAPIDSVDDDPVPKNCSFAASLIGCLACPVTALMSFYTLEPYEEAVILSCGKYAGNASEPGCHFYNCWGRDIRKISKKRISHDLPEVKVVDLHGNPLVMSAVVVYRVNNAARAALQVQSLSSYVVQQAQTVLKQVVSQFPYDGANGDGHSLRTETSYVSEMLVRTLQGKVSTVGVEAVSFSINEISYAPEIAAGMLKRQQAKALVEARQLLVKGAMDIAVDTLKFAEAAGIEFNQSERAKLITNIVTVTCAENPVTTVPVSNS